MLSTSSAHQDGPAVYIDDFAADKACKWRAEEQNRPCNLARSGDAPERNGGEDLLPGHGIVQCRSGHIGGHPSWSDAVYINAFAGQFAGKTFGKADDGALGCGVVGMEGLSALPCRGADENNVSACVLFFHLRHSRLHQAENAVEIDGERPAPLRLAHLCDGNLFRWPDPMIYDEAIYLTESRDGLSNQRAPIFRRRKLLLDGNGAT